MGCIYICKCCTYYNLTVASLMEHEKQTEHNWKVIHTNTTLDGEELL